MRESLKHVNFYKRTLEKGLTQGLKYDNELNLTLEEPGGNGAYITKCFDTYGEGETFNRIVIDGDFENVKLEVIVAATDIKSGYIDGKEAELEDWFADANIPISEKAELMRGLNCVRAVNTKDILLHGLSGRLVWVFIGIYPSGDGKCELRGMRLEFPKYSFTEYFPEIYQGDDFFDKFIAIFQSMYLDQEKRIDDVPLLLDYEATPDENVAYLADWLGIDNPGGVYTTEQLRLLIRNIDLFQGGKGTRFALEKIVELVTGVRPRIVEFFQWSRLTQSENQRKLLGQLYGGSSNDFCVILDLSKRKSPLPIDDASLERIIDSYSVIGTSHKLVFLRRNSHIDTHCYLGVNSCLSTPETATVDGVMLGSHITVG